MLNDLYRDVIIQRYQAPRHRVRLENADASSSAQNPLCGDELSIEVRRESGRIAEAGFQARGCSISHAAADLMVDAIVGKSEPEIEAVAEAFRSMMTTEQNPDPSLGDLLAFQGVKRFPVRVRCALLPWDTLAEALKNAPGS